LPVEIVVEIARHADAASRRVLYRSSRLLRGAVMARRWSRITVNEEGMFALKSMLKARDQLGWTRLGMSLVTSLVFDNLNDADTLATVMTYGKDQLANVTHVVFNGVFIHQLRLRSLATTAAAKKALKQTYALFAQLHPKHFCVTLWDKTQPLSDKRGVDGMYVEVLGKVMQGWKLESITFHGIHRHYPLDSLPPVARYFFNTSEASEDMWKSPDGEVRVLLIPRRKGGDAQTRRDGFLVEMMNIKGPARVEGMADKPVELEGKGSDGEIAGGEAGGSGDAAGAGDEGMVYRAGGGGVEYTGKLGEKYRYWSGCGGADCVCCDKH
jgi:hypothetical protein